MKRYLKFTIWYFIFIISSCNYIEKRNAKKKKIETQYEKSSFILKKSKEKVTSFRFVPGDDDNELDPDKIFLGTDEGYVMKYEIDQGKINEIEPTKIHNKKINSIKKYDNANLYSLSSSDDQTVIIWLNETVDLKKKYSYDEPIKYSIYNPNTETICSLSTNGNIYIQKEKKKLPLIIECNRFESIEFINNKNEIIAINNINQIFLYNTEKGTQSSEYKIKFPEQKFFNCCYNLGFKTYQNDFIKYIVSNGNGTFATIGDNLVCMWDSSKTNPIRVTKANIKISKPTFLNGNKIAVCDKKNVFILDMKNLKGSQTLLYSSYKYNNGFCFLDSNPIRISALGIKKDLFSNEKITLYMWKMKEKYRANTKNAELVRDPLSKKLKYNLKYINLNSEGDEKEDSPENSYNVNDNDNTELTYVNIKLNKSENMEPILPPKSQIPTKKKKGIFKGLFKNIKLKFKKKSKIKNSFNQLIDMQKSNTI